MSRPPRPETLTRLASHMTERDYQLLHALHTHRVMTTTHIGTLWFTSPDARNVRRRLLQLHRWEIIDRFRPPAATGSAPLHWVLAPTGAHILAHRHGTTIDDLGYRHDTAIGVAHSTKLAHIVGLAGTYVAFAHAAHTHPHIALARWRNEKDCVRYWGNYIRPDAYLRWHENHTHVDAFLEYDTGTEPLNRVEKKLRGYADLAAATTKPSRVLFLVPTPTREIHLARTLVAHTSPTVPIYLTTHLLLDDPGPAQAIWRAPTDHTRQHLADLAT